MKSICIIVFLSAFSLGTQAKIYYIDPSGSDLKGNGSSKTPWKSLYKACLVVVTPGDIIHVNKGKYVESIESTLHPGVSIEGEGTSSILTRTDSPEWIGIIKAQSPEGTIGDQHISNLKFDGASQRVAQAIWITGRSNFSIYDCTFVDFNYLAVIWGGRNDQVLGPPSVFANNNKFYNNIIINCSAYADGYARGALYLGGQEGMLIYSNYIHQSGRKPGTNGWPIKMWVNEGYMKGCKIFQNMLYKDDVSNWDFAIEGIWFYGVEIYDNQILGSIDINHCNKGEYEYGLFIHNNVIGPMTLQAKTYTGIICEFEQNDVKIRNNRIKNCAVGISFTPRKNDIISNFDISYNIFENCGQDDDSHYYSAVRFVYDSRNTPFYSIGSLNIYNNVFNGHSTRNPWFGIAMGGFTSAKNVKIINNVFVNFFSTFLMTHNADLIDNLNIQNNIFYNNGNNNEPTLIGKPKNYVKTGNLKTNPRFYSSVNLHPTDPSRCIDAGLPISSLIKDFEGISVSNPPNIGPFETSASDASPLYLGATVSKDNPRTIEISYDLPVMNSSPVTSAFIVKVNSKLRAITDVSVIGTKVRLTLSTPVMPRDAVSLDYTSPKDYPLQSLTGKKAANLSLRWINNNLEP